MGGLCSCFRAWDDEEQEDAGSVEPISAHGTSPHCFQFLMAYNILFQRGQVRPVSSSHQGRATVVSSSDDNSISDTYRPPPRPLPYDDPRCTLSLPQSRTTTSGKLSFHCHEASELGRSSDADGGIEELKKSDFDVDPKKIPSESSVELPLKQTRSGYAYVFPQIEDEDVCPTCLEEYTLENPKITLLCSHHFHLGCIYEWMERSDKCPFCGKAMLFTESQ